MFGYVRVHSPELKVKEYEFYRGTYCGLCRAMGRCTGQCSRMTLSYDFVFLALFRLALRKEEAAEISFERKRCLAHPFKKRSSMVYNDSLGYCAGAAALLAYHKLSDDLTDERGVRRLGALLARPFASRARKKALRGGLAELDTAIKSHLDRLSRTEAEKHQSVDRPAAIFGELLGDIMSFGLEGMERRIASAAGVAVGKWIYIADALDDLPEDEKKGRYNPFLLLFEHLPSPEEVERIRDALKLQLFDAEAAVDLIDFDHDVIEHIIKNILYLGLPNTAEKILMETVKGETNRNENTI